MEQRIENAIREHFPDEPQWKAPLQTVLNGLMLSMEGIENSQDSVIIALYVEEDGENCEDPEAESILFLQELEDDGSWSFNVNYKAVAIVDVAPGPIPGVYTAGRKENGIYDIRTEDSEAFAVSYTGYCILKTAAPDLLPVDIHKVLTQDRWEGNPVSADTPMTIACLGKSVIHSQAAFIPGDDGDGRFPAGSRD